MIPACIALVCLAACLAPAPAEAEWRRLDTPNFIVIGDVSERNLRSIAVQFEGFRETLGRVLSPNVTATAVPTVVVVFPHDGAFTPFKPLYNGKSVDAGGVFYGGRDANYITLVSDGREGRLRVLFHEYAHLMMSNVIRNLPTWLSEGLAEYYSTYDPAGDGREAIIGRPVESHLRRLAEGRLLPLRELIAVDRSSPLYNEGERRSVFYAQSWALTHLLLLGEPARLTELTVFIRAVESGVSASEAWRQAFGEADLDRALQQYIRQFSFKAYRFKFPDGLARIDAAARAMPQPEVAAFLAGLRIRQQRVADAESLADAALATDKGNLHANVAKAHVEIAKGERAAAAGRLTTIGAAEDWFAGYAAGTMLTDTLAQERQVAAERLAAVRTHLGAAARTREIPNALADLARLDLLAPHGATAETRTTIERARALAPGRDDYILLHAQVLADLAEFALARRALGPLMTPVTPEPVRFAARSLMGVVVRREERQRAIASPPAAPPPPASAGRAADDRADPPTRVEPAYRALQTGEQRLEGTVERISCPANAAVSFHVRTTQGRVLLHAPKFDAVDFITFRDDLAGRITCGAFETPVPVYVTWRHGAWPDARIVIAIEFLPK